MIGTAAWAQEAKLHQPVSFMAAPSLCKKPLLVSEDACKTSVCASQGHPFLLDPEHPEVPSGPALAGLEPLKSLACSSAEHPSPGPSHLAVQKCRLPDISASSMCLQMHCLRGAVSSSLTSKPVLDTCCRHSNGNSVRAAATVP